MTLREQIEELAEEVEADPHVSSAAWFAERLRSALSAEDPEAHGDRYREGIEVAAKVVAAALESVEAGYRRDELLAHDSISVLTSTLRTALKHILALASEAAPEPERPGATGRASISPAAPSSPESAQERAGPTGALRGEIASLSRARDEAVIALGRLLAAWQVAAEDAEPWEKQMEAAESEAERVAAKYPKLCPGAAAPAAAPPLAARCPHGDPRCMCQAPMAPPPGPDRARAPDFIAVSQRLVKEWERRTSGIMAGREMQELEDALRDAYAAGHPAAATALVPWYEADGSAVMLPAPEVERKRKLAAKVIGAARRWHYAMCGVGAERAARGLKDRATELMNALRALDALTTEVDRGE